MKLHPLILFMTLPLLALAVEPDATYDQEAFLDAAYFGETQKLVAMFDAVKASDKEYDISKTRLINYAMASGHKDTVKAIIDQGWPMAESDIRDVLIDTHISADMITLFNESIPDFRKKYGVDSLYWAVASGKVELTRALIELGVNTNHLETAPLLTAMEARDMPMIDLLLKHGADPYLGKKPSRLIDKAAQLRSRLLIQKLDTRGEYAQLAAELEKSLPPKASKFAGAWLYLPDGGFGGMALHLFSDGSGFAATMAGMLPMTWKHASPDTVQLNPISDGEKPKKKESKTITLQLSADGSEATWIGGDVETVFERRKLHRREPVSHDYPLIVRFEHAWMTQENDLIVQINQMRIRVPLSNIIEGAKASKYHDEPFKMNILNWIDFKDIAELPVPPNSHEVKYMDRRVSTRYSRSWKTLQYNENEKVVLGEGVDQMLFRAPPSYYSEGAEQSTEQLQAWALMRKQPFPHGPDWLTFFLKSSKENKYAKAPDVK